MHINPQRAEKKMSLGRTILRQWRRFALAFAAVASIGYCGAAASDEPYHIGVWYFTRWSSSNNDPPARRSLAFYGRMDAWAGIRDNAEGHGKFAINDDQGKPVDYSYREPLIGYYDEMSQEVVDKEILMAASEGIEFFAFYWYLDPQTGEELTISKPLANFFNSKVRGKVKYVLSPLISENSSAPLTLDIWTRKVVPKLIAYAANDAYYKIDGRPVIIDFSNQFTPAKDRATAYAVLRSAMQSQLHVNPFLVTLQADTADYPAYMWVKQAMKADAVTCFQFPPKKPNESYADDMSNWVAEMLKPLTAPDGSLDRSMFFFPCGSNGMDNRPWLAAESEEALQKLPYTAGVTPEAFRTHLQSLKALMDKYPGWTRKTAVIYAWNEWGEAARDIEPSRTLGYSYADVLREVFGLTPEAERPAAAPSAQH